MIRVMTVFIMLIIILVAAIILDAQKVDAQPLCYGLEATIIGTPDDDVIDGTDGPDVIIGLLGNDKINGLGGDDVICGGKGSDLILGGVGDDQLSGGPGRDILRGKAGDDVLKGDGADDILNGGHGIDQCHDQYGLNTHKNCETDRCDFIPAGDFFDAEINCANLAKAFKCKDYNMDEGFCEVTGCEPCLCDTISISDPFGDIASSESTCESAGDYYGCYKTDFDEICVLLICPHEAHCGPLDVIDPY